MYLKVKTRNELENMLIERQSNLLFGYKIISRGEATEGELAQVMKQLEKEIDILERKLK
ncbi:hypothetical protein [Bacillus sp. AFS002410]|uniref:hypothetical protein n=1 Tax=Bacillus sp. AFS002410 TaxID=2033481 RepID=UPI0015CF4230|nr:hypothetical protein [Bacillus sp. AFS002410]